MKNILRTLIITSIISVPLIVSAQGINATQGLVTLGGLVNTFTNTIVKSVAYLLAALAMVAFFYGIVQFIWGSREGKADVMTNGKKFMLWGLVALFVMFSVWGIVRYFQNVFGVQGNTITIPSIQGGSSGGSLQNGSNPYSVSPTQTNPFGSNPPLDYMSQCIKQGNSYLTCDQMYKNQTTQTNPFGTAGTQTNPFQTSGDIVQPGTTAGYGSGTAGCTPPQVQSPEGGCYTPATTGSADATQNCTNAGGVIQADGSCLVP